MPYVAARHITYNGVVYERGEVVPVTEETLGRIESYLATKTLTFMEKAPKKASAPAPVVEPEPVIETLAAETEEVVAEEEVVETEVVEPQIVALNTGE
jgi:hypothetical protein